MESADHIPITEAPRAMFSTWVGVVLLFALFGLIAWAIMGVLPRRDHYEETRAKARAEKLKTLQEENAKALTTYGWVDKAKGTAHVPVERAMQLMVTELAQKKPAPANAIEQPAAPGASPQAVSVTQTGANSATPAPTSVPAASASPKASTVAGDKSEARNQPAAAANPPSAQPGTQPGAVATPAANPGAQTGKPAVSPSITPSPTPAGKPLPVPGRTP